MRDTGTACSSNRFSISSTIRNRISGVYFDKFDKTRDSRNNFGVVRSNFRHKSEKKQSFSLSNLH